MRDAQQPSGGVTLEVRKTIDATPERLFAAWTDPGGYLESYKRIPAPLRVHDILIEEPTGDLYWPSEYSTAAGTVNFAGGRAYRSHVGSTCAAPDRLIPERQPIPISRGPAHERSR